MHTSKQWRNYSGASSRALGVPWALARRKDRKIHPFAEARSRPSVGEAAAIFIKYAVSKTDPKRNVSQ